MAKAEEIVQEHVAAQLRKLSDIHQSKMVAQIADLWGLSEWEQCLCSIPFESGDINWAMYSPSHGNKKSLEDLIHVEFVLDDKCHVPMLDILDGFVIRQDVAHRRMRRCIENPRILIFLGALAQTGDDGIATFDGMKNSKGTEFVDLIEETSPDVILASDRASHSLVETLFQGGITLLSGIDSDTLLLMKSMFEAEYHTDLGHQETKSGPDFAFGVCSQFLADKVLSTNDDDDDDRKYSGDEASTLNRIYEEPFCKIITTSACSKTALVHYSCSEQFAKLAPLIKWLMLSTCWKYLEVSFLIDFFTYQGSRPKFEAFLRRANCLMLEREREIGSLSTSMFSGYKSFGKASSVDDIDSDHHPNKFCTATFCFNPDKEFLCEAAHQHCVDTYGLEDLSIVEYFMAASPRNIKCTHPDCGFDVCAHKRAFVSNKSSVTISSLYMDGETTSVKNDGIFIWVENTTDSCRYPLKMSRTSTNLSISHLLSLIVCGGLFSLEDDKAQLCVMKETLIVKFAFQVLSPYSFVLPEKSQSINEHRWIQDDLEILQALLEDISNSVRETELSLEQVIDVLSNLQSEVCSLSELFRDGARMKNYSTHLLTLDSVHYLISIFLSLLTADCKRLRALGLDEETSSHFLEIDAPEQKKDCDEERKVNADPSAWLQSQFSEEQKQILAKMIKISRSKLDGPATFLVRLHDITSIDSMKGSFFWDGDNWRFHHGDKSCSMISCFLSSRMYYNFVDSALTNLHHLHGKCNDWLEILSLTCDMPETCQIILGDSKLESYCAMQFHALREIGIQGGNETFLMSMRNCHPWSATGGKSNAFFAKTSDDKFIVKQISKSERQSFIDFSEEYFHHVGLVLEDCQQRSGFAKIFGMFRVSSGEGLKSRNDPIDFIVMENVFHSRHLDQAYDLKGFSRELHERGDAQQAVLVDGNLRSKIQKYPIFVSLESKNTLMRSMKFDTDFLGKVNVMDYSLLVGIDTSTNEIIVGIVDYLRRYTLDKHIESWVKLLGAAGEKPTVISPPQYASRFREGIESYFTTVPYNF